MPTYLHLGKIRAAGADLSGSVGRKYSGRKKGIRKKVFYQ
jgi:hypothetical protein